jgi:hypothetical protein
MSVESYPTWLVLWVADPELHRAAYAPREVLAGEPEKIPVVEFAVEGEVT